MTTNTGRRPAARAASRALAAMLAAAALVAGLTGCRDGAGAGRDAAPLLEELAVPQTLEPEGPVVDHLTIVPETDNLPWFVSGVRTEPGGVPRAVTWVAAADGTLPAEPAVLETVGAVRELAAAGDDSVAAVAGSARDADGTVRPFVLRSEDRATWADVELPVGSEPLRLSQAAAVDGEIWAVGVDPVRDVVAGVRVGRDGEAVAVAFPEHEGRPTVTGVAGNSSAVLVAVTWDEGAGDPVTVTYRSTDQGRSWREHLVPGDRAGVAGLGVTRDGFVLTGTLRTDYESGPVTSLAAWFWDFGAAGWELSELGATGQEGSSVGLAAPALGGPELAAVVWGEDLGANSLLLEEGASIHTQGMSPPNGGTGFTGPSAWTADGRAVRAVLAGDGSARVVEVADGEWSEVATLTEVQRFAQPDDSVAAGEGALWAVGQGFEVVGEGWRRWTTSSELALDAEAGELVQVAGPDAPAADTRTQHAVAADGTELRVMTGWSQDLSVVVSTASVRRGPDAEWSAGVPLSTDAFTSVEDVARVPGRGDDGQWLVVGQRADSMDAGEPRSAAAWTSSDGTSWTPVAEIGDDATAFGASDVCVLPDGSPLVLGDGADGVHDLEIAWARTGDGWVRTELDPEDAFDGGACLDAQPGGGALLQVSVDGRTELRSTVDGIAFEVLTSTEDGETLGDVVAVEGGYASVGTVVGTGTEENVLWFSADGSSWSRTALPSRTVGHGTVHPVGTGVVVTVTGPGGVQAWHVRDVAALVPGDEGKVGGTTG